MANKKMKKIYDAYIEEHNNMNNYILNKKHYLYPENVIFILNAIIDAFEHNKNSFETFHCIGVDAASGNGKSYTAKLLHTLINKYGLYKKKEDTKEGKDSIQIDTSSCKAENDSHSKVNNLLKNNFKYRFDLDSVKQLQSIYISLDQFDYNQSLEHIIYILYERIHSFLLISDEYSEVYYNSLTKSYLRFLKATISNFKADTRIKRFINFVKNFKTLLDSREKGAIVWNDSYKNHEDMGNLVKALQDIIDNELSRNKTVFIIDNLDRCNPEFVNSFIEKIKCFFKSKNVLFVFMINQEYTKRLSEGRYSNSVDMHYYYNIIFSKTSKLYLKPKELFIEDMLNMVGLNSIKQYSYFADFYNDENVKKEVKQINDKLGLTLFEIEKVIEKMDGFLRKRQFMLNGDDKIKCIKVKHTSSLLNNALIMLFYSLVALQITNIKLFNKILYDEIYFEERTFNEVTNWKEDGIEKISLIVFKNPQIQDMMKSNDCLETIYNKFVISENGNIISIYDNTLFNEENGMIINESNIGIIKNIYRPISKDKFHISFLYSYDDYKVMGKDISKMFSFTFKEYLRFQISQM